MAELADAPDLGSGVYDVQVRPLLPAPDENKTNPRENLEFVFSNRMPGKNNTNLARHNPGEKRRKEVYNEN